MASFSYTRSFAHVPWRNHEDVVDAEGDNGFNRRFQDLESEFDDVASTIGDIAAEVDTISGGLPLAGRQQFLTTQSVNIPGSDVTAPAVIDTYDNADFPSDVPKLYSVRISPTLTAPHAQVSHHFTYRQGATQTEVEIWFRNERNQATAVIAQIFVLS
ncbi:hypothetical protein [Marinibacterium sp. SX1]|uniref:hypothetical protein n=1 Tax=Marinibacterium sp. SX1 TaxID=3388424 RepID=UPI003D166835